MRARTFNTFKIALCGHAPFAHSQYRPVRARTINPLPHRQSKFKQKTKHLTHSQYFINLSTTSVKKLSSKPPKRPPFHTIQHPSTLHSQYKIKNNSTSNPLSDRVLSKTYRSAAKKNLPELKIVVSLHPLSPKKRVLKKKRRVH